MDELPPSKYVVKLTKTSQKDYESIRDEKLRRGVNRILDEIAENPYQFKKLSGPLSHLRSAKTFSFRIIYQIEENGELLIWIMGIGNRRDIYRRFGL